MIRMGRGGSKTTEQSGETPQQQYQTQPQTNSGNPYGYQQQEAVHPTSSRAVTESESIARDIKEGRLSGYVGAGTVLTGETSFQAMLRIDGHLTGRVTSENGTLVVGSTGRVDADIVVVTATIGGTVNGDIIAAEKVELGRTARVLGNIQTPRLVIEDGAIFEGNCSMMKAKESAEKRAEEARQAQYSAAEYAAAETPVAEYAETDTDEVSEAAAS
jgi:cytoskeletal protein CcmA (bactofilin family)